MNNDDERDYEEEAANRREMTAHEPETPEMRAWLEEHVPQLGARQYLQSGRLVGPTGTDVAITVDGAGNVAAKGRIVLDRPGPCPGRLRVWVEEPVAGGHRVRQVPYLAACNGEDGHFAEMCSDGVRSWKR